MGPAGTCGTSGHHDFAPVHLMTRQSLEHMRAIAPAGDWDVRRFRPNLLLDDRTGECELSEARLVDRELTSVAGVRMNVGLPTPRCVVPTRATEELRADLRLLKHLAAESRWDLGPFGRPVCLGTYAEVPTGGALRVGDVLAVGARAAASGQDAVKATVARLERDLFA